MVNTMLGFFGTIAASVGAYIAVIKVKANAALKQYSELVEVA